MNPPRPINPRYWYSSLVRTDFPVANGVENDFFGLQFIWLWDSIYLRPRLDWQAPWFDNHVSATMRCVWLKLKDGEKGKHKRRCRARRGKGVTKDEHRLNNSQRSLSLNFLELRGWRRLDRRLWRRRSIQKQCERRCIGSAAARLSSLSNPEAIATGKGAARRPRIIDGELTFLRAWGQKATKSRVTREGERISILHLRPFLSRVATWVNLIEFLGSEIV